MNSWNGLKSRGLLRHLYTRGRTTTSPTHYASGYGLIHFFGVEYARGIATVILVFFTWFCVAPWTFAQAAQSPSGPSSPTLTRSETAVERFETALRSIKQVTTSLDQHLAEGKAISSELGTLEAHNQVVQGIDKGVPVATEQKTSILYRPLY